MNDFMRDALELIAIPQRPDGTWNRDRESCRQLAVEALQAQRDAIEGPVPFMTLRDYFAAKAMQAMMIRPGSIDGMLSDSRTALAYKIADAMAKARNAAHGIEGDV